eukprot:Skav220753  [mRNA]  locus=scaffold6504:34656:35498:- [translate_table: standard]
MPAKAEGMKPQELSNSLWACAQLKEGAPHVLQIVPAVSAEIPSKAEGMTPQELSNSLWTCAQLKEIAPCVLQIVPAVSAEIPSKAKDMTPQHLSNCLWAALHLEDDEPEVLKIVLPVTTEVSIKIQDMKPQELANSLQALVPLQELVPEIARLVADNDGEEDIIRNAIGHFAALLPQLSGKDLSIAVPTVVWACAKLGVYPADGFLVSVSDHLGSRRKLSKLPRFNLCALAWSYQVLDASDDFKDFKGVLKAVVRKRGCSEADVESTKLGHLKWKYALVP